MIRPGIVHRLDKGTTGLLVAAKDARTLAALAKQFKAHTVRPSCVGPVHSVKQGVGSPALMLSSRSGVMLLSAFPSF